MPRQVRDGMAGLLPAMPFTGTAPDFCCGKPDRGNATLSLEDTMRHPSPLLGATCACLLGASLLAYAQTGADAAVDPAAAKQQAREIASGDPARWYREDATRQARLRTLHKEIGAALQEAKNACKKAPAAERNACLQEARTTYQRDMAQAKAQLDGQEHTP